MQLGGAVGLIIVSEQMVEGERSVKESRIEENCVHHRFSWLQPLDLELTTATHCQCLHKGSFSICL